MPEVMGLRHFVRFHLVVHYFVHVDHAFAQSKHFFMLIIILFNLLVRKHIIPGSFYF
jgi:hypothetical protein